MALQTERDSHRRQIVDAVGGSGQLSALTFYGKGRDTDVRTESFRRMVRSLLDRGVQRLIIEFAKSAISATARCLIEELRRLDRPNPFRYVHLPPHVDPLL